MEVRNNGSYGVVIAYDSENPSRRIVMSQSEAIELRDLLLREFPVVTLRDELERDDRNRRKERRERIATAVLAGMLAQTPCDPNLAADDAILQADALIAALDKE